MTIYLLKTILCSGLLLFFYFLLFEKEKMHVLKRYYILLGLFMSFIVPLFKYEVINSYQPVETQYIAFQERASSLILQDNDIILESKLDRISLSILIIYIIITSVLLYRLIRNLMVFAKNRKLNRVINYEKASLVLTHNKVVPHSFFKYIYLNKEEYENGQIEDEVLAHELAHVNQKHSLDILAIELSKALVWFNPFIYLYSRAIRLNHEFLADLAVIQETKDTLSYQQILLSKAGQISSLNLSSQFNYLTYKKRLIMMTKTTPVFTLILKQLFLIPLLATTVYLFSSKVIAQSTIPPNIKSVKNKQVKQNQEGVSQVLLNEYQEIIKRNSNPGKVPGASFYAKISDQERNRLESIFKQMSQEQQAQQTIVFLPPAPPLPRIIPTKEQVEKWKNAELYGVWLDGKRINNDVLSKYENTDIVLSFVSKLEKNANNYGKHYYQVDLITKEYYEVYLKKALPNKQYMMAVRKNFK